MGDLQVCSAQRENFVRAREDCLYGSTTSSFESNPDPSSITKENWEAAERRTNEILCKIRPTLVADKKRREVIQYVRDLITGSLGCEVFPYGSVPLKTYLPDGDIDLTAISTPNFEDTLVSDVHAVLKSEEHTKSAHYEVKDVHIIDAEVKLVKCLVQNIVVDISFNQLGGLSTLCFLELVDGIIGKDHLFKRSIILIKAWCYYESRILGAHHGLLSTYALETLVLYIFHLFHSSLDGPLAVLYRFLYYFSKFDWENYCVSLNGPVCKSSLADIVVRGPENGREGLLLSEEFLQECFDKFSVSSRGMETDSRAFPQKHLNIIDVLKENNNLGRSVNRGNSYRIRSAFKYGARNLGQILMLPNERLADELNKFLANTLQRRGDEYWTDVQHFAPAACSRSADCLVSTEHYEDSAFLRSSGAGYGNDKTSGFRNNQKGHSLKAVFTQAVPKLNCTSAKIAVPRSHHSGNAKVVAPGILSSRNRDDSSSCLSLSTNFCASLSRKSQQAPRGNVKVENGSPRGIQARSVADDDMSFALWPESKNSSMTISSIFSSNNHENIAPNILPLSTAAPNNMENAFSTIRDRNSNIVEKSESLKPLLDLSGHYENCFSNLIYAKNYHVSAPVLLSPTMSHQLQSNNLWEMIWQSVQLEPKAYSKMNASSDLGTQFYPVNPLLSSNAVFTAEDRKRSRGTGTYFPKMNYHSNGDRPLSGRGRFNTTGAYGQRPSYKNGLVTASTETNFSVESLVIASTERKFSGEGSHDLSQEDFPVLGNGKSGYSDAFRPQSSVWGSSKANGFFHQSERHEPGFCEVRLGEVPLPEVTAQLASDTSPCLDSASVLEIPAAQSPNSVTESNQESNADFHLKNEIEFPSLSLGEKVKI